MIKWRGKTVTDLSRTELNYALQDAILALMHAKKANNEDHLFRGLLYGGFLGAVLAASAIMFGLMI